MSAYYCTPCKRSFKHQGALDTHLRDSSKHKLTTQIPPLAVASGSSAPQVTIPAVQATTQSAKAKSPWSEIPASEHKTVLDELSAHCHSSQELEKFGYIVRPYDPQDYVNVGKCQRCNGKPLVFGYEDYADLI